jgi:hypothetical protein
MAHFALSDDPSAQHALDIALACANATMAVTTPDGATPQFFTREAFAALQAQRGQALGHFLGKVGPRPVPDVVLPLPVVEPPSVPPSAPPEGTVMVHGAPVQEPKPKTRRKGVHLEAVDLDDMDGDHVVDVDPVLLPAPSWVEAYTAFEAAHPRPVPIPERISWWTRLKTWLRHPWQTWVQWAEASWR